ncbi:unnamed protein product [Lepidochelys kempii]
MLTLFLLLLCSSSPAFPGTACSAYYISKSSTVSVSPSPPPCQRHLPWISFSPHMGLVTSLPIAVCSHQLFSPLLNNTSHSSFKWGRRGWAIGPYSATSP